MSGVGERLGARGRSGLTRGELRRDSQILLFVWLGRPMTHREDEAPAALLPLHAVPLDGGGRALHVKRRAGRPRRVERKPDADELDYVRQINARRRAHVDRDALVSAIQADDSRQILSAAELGLAREAASLMFEIERRQNKGGDVAQLHSRRVDALVKLASIVLSRRKLFPADPGEYIPKITAFFIESVAAVLHQTLDPQRADVLIREMSARLGTGGRTFDE